MRKGIIELNDASIGLGLDGHLIERSAGYAVLDQNNLLLGVDAQKNVKRLPRWTNNRFWHQLNTDGINNATGVIRHHADLAFAHLENLKTKLACDELVVAVPGQYDKAQLGLLLGMCREADLPVKALIDLAVLSVANQPSHSDALFLDASLHNISLTKLRTDGALRQTGQVTLLETGLATFWDRWASLIAEQFIQSSRFDPMHEAASEQQLFDALPEFIESIGASRALNFELNLGSVTHSTALSKEQLLSVTANAYPSIIQGIRQHAPQNSNFTLFVSPRLRHLPELATSLSLIPDAQIIHLSDDQAIKNSEQLWASMIPSNGAVSHVTTLAVSTLKPTTALEQLRPTHLLIGDTAFSLRNTRSVIGFSGILEEDATDAIAMITKGRSNSGNDDRDQILLTVLKNGLSKNGEPVAIGTHALDIGDVLAIGNHQARAIAEQ